MKVTRERALPHLNTAEFEKKQVSVVKVLLASWGSGLGFSLAVMSPNHDGPCGLVCW